MLGVVSGVPGRRRSLIDRTRAYCGDVDTEQAFPVIRQTVLDTTDPRRLAEFYRQLFGLRYHPDDEPPGSGQPDPEGQDWLILTSPAGGVALAFQKVGELPEATWPDGPIPQQLHLNKPGFLWERDGEALLRKHKPWCFGAEPQPPVTPLSSDLAGALPSSR